MLADGVQLLVLRPHVDGTRANVWSVSKSEELRYVSDLVPLD